MNLQMIKLLLLISLIFQVGCDITLKRKNQDQKMDSMDKKSNKNTYKNNKNTIKQVSSMQAVIINDANIIRSYYADAANAMIRKDIFKNNKVTQQQTKKLVVGEIISSDIQVVPLPLELVKKLSSLSLYVIRVQVGSNVILMDTKTRRILTIIKM